MQNPDKFERDYPVYCTTREEVEDEKPAPKKRKSKNGVRFYIYGKQVLMYDFTSG